MKTPFGQLAYQVFISDPVAFNDAERDPDGGRRMFQPISSTLVFGDTDAVLVDPPMTIDQTERVGEGVERSGQRSRVLQRHGRALPRPLESWCSLVLGRQSTVQVAPSGCACAPREP